MSALRYVIIAIFSFFFLAAALLFAGDIFGLCFSAGLPLPFWLFFLLNVPGSFLWALVAWITLRRELPRWFLPFIVLVVAISVAIAFFIFYLDARCRMLLENSGIDFVLTPPVFVCPWFSWFCLVSGCLLLFLCALVAFVLGYLHKLLFCSFLPAILVSVSTLCYLCLIVVKILLSS